jgi:flagellar motor switch protein FliG
MTNTKPFKYFNRINPMDLLNLIYYEHPQTIAAILVFLSEKKSAKIITNMSYETQSDVIRRMATIDSIDESSIRKTEEILLKKIEERKHILQSPGGIDYVVKLLSNTSALEKKRLIEALEDEDPELAEEIKKDLCSVLDVDEETLFDTIPEHALPD